MNERRPDLRPAVDVLRSRWAGRPRYGIVLGTGADAVADQIETVATIPYHQLPGFPKSTALGHRGQWVCGTLAGQEIIAMQGRFHPYEGYGDRQVALPIQLMGEIGVTRLFISNASGGLNPNFVSGDLMIIESHLDLMFRRWQPAANLMLSPRNCHRSDVYDASLIDRAMRHARREDFVLHRGVYAALLGPNYETRAEYRMLRKLGADVVGMSTVPEVVAAAHLKMRVLACSLVANVAKPDVLQSTSGQQVIDAAAVAAPRFCSIVTDAIRQDALRGA